MKTRRNLIQLCLLAVMVLALPGVVKAQFTFTTNTDGSLTITGYTGSNDAVIIPDATNGLTVTSIGSSAFYGQSGLTNLTISSNVTSIGDHAFYGCTGLTNIVIPNSVTNIGVSAFEECTRLVSITLPSGISSIGASVFQFAGFTNVTIPSSVTSIGTNSFAYCRGLTSVTIPDSVTNIQYGAFSQSYNITNLTIGNNVTTIGSGAFGNCHITYLSLPNSLTSIGDYAFEYGNYTNVTIPNSVTNLGQYVFSGTPLVSIVIPGGITYIGNDEFYDDNNLKSVYFKGNAPSYGGNVFLAANNSTVYYLSGTTGWSSTFAGRPAVLWNPQAQTGDGSFGVQSNGFGFNITGSSNLVIVVEASTNLFNPVWSPVSTNVLNTFIGTNGTSYFSDPQWTNYPGRFYRLRSP